MSLFLWISAENIGIYCRATSSMSYASLSAEELVRACAESGNTEAWEEFVRRFRLVIGSAVRRIAYIYGKPNDAVIDELIQDTYLKVCNDRCRMLRDFKPQYPDAFFGMLKVTAANIAHDYFRREQAPIHGGGIVEIELTDVEEFIPDSRSTGPASIEREILLREIDDILRAFPRHPPHATGKSSGFTTGRDLPPTLSLRFRVVTLEPKAWRASFIGSNDMCANIWWKKTLLRQCPSRAVKVFGPKIRSIKKRGSYETRGYAFNSAGIAVAAL